MMDTMSESDLPGIEREVGALLDRLDRLYEEAAVAIDAITDPAEAFTYATGLADQARDFHNQVAGKLRKLRGRQAVRIRQAEDLSLQGLASRISVSKARADQLIRAATVKAKEGT
jgi:DNA-binding transcriptional regulator YiaG